MPRPLLEKYPIELLKAEIQRRARKAGKKLAKLVRERAKLDSQIAELEALTGTTPAMPAPKGKPGRKLGRPPGKKRGPKPKAAAQVEVPRKKRGAFTQTGAEFVLGLVKTPKTTSEINAAWKKAGRGGTADMTLSNLFKTSKLKREKLKDAKGSTYSLKGAAPVKVPSKRGTFAQTASEFILSLVKGKGATTAEICKTWAAAGRGGKADNALTKLFKDGKVKREKLPAGKGSTYTLA